MSRKVYVIYGLWGRGHKVFENHRYVSQMWSRVSTVTHSPEKLQSSVDDTRRRQLWHQKLGLSFHFTSLACL